MKLIIFFLIFSIFSNELENWNRENKDKKEILIQYLNCKLKEKLIQEVCIFEKKLPSIYPNLGIFITFLKKGKIRGCFGGFDHKYSLTKKNLDEYLISAIDYDKRFLPIQAEEFSGLKIVLTISEKPIQIDKIDFLKLGKEGLFLKNENGEEFIFVPEELKQNLNLKKILNEKKISEIYKFNAVSIR